MALDGFKKTLNRFKKDDFAIFEKWGGVGEELLKRIDLPSDTKQTTVHKILKFCERRKISGRKFSELDLIYLQEYSTRLQWSVFQFTKDSENDDLTNPKDFEREFKQQLRFYFNADLCVGSHNGALWTRLYVQETKNFQATNLVFIVHYPHTPILLMSRVKVAHKEYIIQSLMNVLDALEAKELQLTGYHLESLTELALYRASQGAFSKYRHTEAFTNPLSRGKKRKEPDEGNQERALGIVYENEEEKKRRQVQLEDTFGTETQPILEKIEYRLETKFRGTREAPEMSTHDNLFRCRVKFEGNSVLEGIRNLAQCGLAQLPLPKHLGQVHSLAKNHFVIAEKKK